MTPKRSNEQPAEAAIDVLSSDSVALHSRVDDDLESISKVMNRMAALSDLDLVSHSAASRVVV